MATRRKRTTTKTGNFSKRTVTVSTNGTRVTNSFRPPGGATRRTSSIDLRTGKTRVTHTTHQGGGWSTTRSKSGGPGKSKTAGSGRRKSYDDYTDEGGDFALKVVGVIFFLIILSIVL
jgi:hypothetical protein